MLEKALSQKELSALLGMTTFEFYKIVCCQIVADYHMEHIGYKCVCCLRYEYKYRRGGRTLCGLYLRESCLGFMVILGKAEREKFEQDRANFSDSIVQAYDAATTYHDGKWLMIELQDERLFADLKKLLYLKRKPNK